MEVIGIILGDAERRVAYNKNPGAAFESARSQALIDNPELADARYEHIPDIARGAFERMAVEELAFLGKFGDVLTEAGMTIDVEGVGKCYIK